MGIYQIYHPAVFQGNRNRKDYFEGWYFKQVSNDYSQVLALIPGVSLSNDPHAFVQVIDGKSGNTQYIEFPLSDFSANTRKFEIRIGNNIFTQNSCSIDIDRQGFQLKGELHYPNIRPWPVKPWSPGIMGWYRFVPGMECYHGVVSLNHEVYGSLTGSDITYNFDRGYGYIEKDWGTSFPEQWIWLHANCFAERETALMLSIAKIPWKGKYFVGFLCFLYTSGRLYRFLTYNGAQITRAERDGSSFSVIIKNSGYQIQLTAEQLLAGELKAPVFGRMDRYIKESIDSKVHFQLTDRRGSVLAEGDSLQAGLELVGDVISLL